MFKTDFYDTKLKLSDLYFLCLLFNLDFAKAKKIIFFNLSGLQRKKEFIDYKVFLNLIKYYNIRLESYAKISNEREAYSAKIQTFFELSNVWPELKTFYTSRFGDRSNQNYNKDIIDVVACISELTKQRNMDSRNRMWFLYLYLERKELSCIR